jgi:hypothetical protein
MLILLRSKDRPKFHVNDVSLGSFIVMFSFVLVTVEIFECSGPRSTARLPKRFIAHELYRTKNIRPCFMISPFKLQHKTKTSNYQIFNSKGERQ